MKSRKPGYGLRLFSANRLDLFCMLLLLVLIAADAQQIEDHRPPQQSPMGVSTGPPHAAVTDAQSRPITAGGFVDGAPVIFEDATRRSGLDQFHHHSGSPDKATILESVGSGLALLDYDNDGWLDIYLLNGSTFAALHGQEPAPRAMLFHNNHDGTFTETGLLAGVAFDSNGRSQAGMGVDAADYDGDGRLDIIKSNFSDETPTLYHNEGHGFFTDVTFPAGLGGATRSVKWGTAFLDFDNDGRPDLLIVSGPIYPPGITGRHRMADQEGRKLLYHNTGNGRFEDVSDRSGAGMLETRCSRGLAVGDIFRRGQVDAVINNINDRATLLQNQAPSPNSWLLIRLIGTKTNRAAIGSRVLVEADGRRQVQEVRSGGSFCSQSDLRLHFGLGRARESQRIEVQWLSGAKEILEHVSANHLVTIQEGKGIVSQESW